MPNFRRTYVGAFVAVLLLATNAARGTAPQIEAVSRLDNPQWARRHALKLAELSQHPIGLVMLGDSIMQELQRRSADPQQNLNSVWQRYFGPFQPIDLGFAGDTTANLLWRIRNGEVDGIAPHWAVVLIGTNDLAWAGHNNPAQIVAMIQEIVQELAVRLPKTGLIVLGLLPRAVDETGVMAVNDALRQVDWAAKNIVYLELGNLLMSDGRLDPALYLDPLLHPPHQPLHPNAVGWGRLAAALVPHLAAAGPAR